MRRPALAAIVWLAGTAAVMAQQNAPPTSALQSVDESELVSLAAQLSISRKMKLVLYAEHGGEVIGLTVIARPHGASERILYDGEEVQAMRVAFVDEARALGADARPSILIVADNGETIVRRGPSPEPFAGYTARLRAEVDRALPPN
jgi:hypothetical protein